MTELFHLPQDCPESVTVTVTVLFSATFLQEGQSVKKV